MNYSFDLIVQANTLESEKINLVCPVNYGILREVEIFFPWGCAGLVHAQIKRLEHQLFPSNVDSSYTGNDYHLKFEEYFPILALPYELSLVAWNLDDYFDHVLTVNLLVIHPSAISQVAGENISETELLALLGEYQSGGNL